MLGTILKNRGLNRTRSNKFLLLIAILVLSATGAIRAAAWLQTDQRSLLTWKPGLEYINPDTTQVNAMLPTDVLGADLYEVGMYTENTDAFPQNTVAIVLVRDGWRFVEIDYLPSRDLEKQAALYAGTHSKKVVIGDQTALLAYIDTNPRCIDYEDDVPNRCEISRQIAFDKDDVLIMISADGNHATDGELIKLANNILSTP